MFFFNEAMRVATGSRAQESGGEGAVQAMTEETMLNKTRHDNTYVCVYIYMYMYICVYIYIYIYAKLRMV